MPEISTLLPDAAVNYTPTNPDTLAGHFEGIDDALGSAGSVDSVNGATGTVVLDGTDIESTHTAVNYTAADETIDAHLSGIDTALISAGGSTKFAVLYRHTSQLFTQNAANILQFDTADANNTLTVNTGSYSIEADKTGLHRVKSRISCFGWTAGVATVNILVNGSVTETLTYQIPSSGKQTINVDEVISLTVGDDVTIGVSPSVAGVSLTIPSSNVEFVQAFSHSGDFATNALNFSGTPSVGNLKIASIFSIDLNSPTITGWTSLYTDPTNRNKVFYRIHQSGDGTNIPLGSMSGVWRCTAAEFSNINTETPLASSASYTNTSTTPSISVSVPNATQVVHYYWWVEGLTYTGMTLRANSTWTDGDDENHINAIYTRQLTNAGSTSTISSSASGDFNPRQITYALNPLVATGKHPESSYLALFEV